MQIQNFCRSPKQKRPPFAGIGLLHSLSLMVTPPPQVLEQDVGELQSLQPPFTAFGRWPASMHLPWKHHWKQVFQDYHKPKCFRPCILEISKRILSDWLQLEITLRLNFFEIESWSKDSFHTKYFEYHLKRSLFLQKIFGCIHFHTTSEVECPARFFLHGVPCRHNPCVILFSSSSFSMFERPNHEVVNLISLFCKIALKLPYIQNYWRVLKESNSQDFYSKVKSA